MILNLEEAIKYYSELAEENEKDAEQFKRIKATQDIISHCYECAEEHRQLAEWLRELKKLREIPDKLVPKYRDGIQDEYDHGANEMLEEIIDDIRKYIEEVETNEISD